MATIEESPNLAMPEDHLPEGYDIQMLALEGAKSIVHDTRFQEMPRVRQAEEARKQEDKVRKWFPGAKVSTGDFLPEQRRR